jgi:hypothetical protein
MNCTALLRVETLKGALSMASLFFWYTEVNDITI